MKERAMKKLSLDPDALRVESFKTASAAKVHGTVEGAQLSVGCPPTGCTCGIAPDTTRADVRPTVCYCCV
jgi:hypothetical protein